VSEGYEFSKPDIIAAELSYYIELLDSIATSKLSKQKQKIS
jgi:hypothetical protein